MSQASKELIPWAEQAIRERLKGGRLAHSFSVAETAVSLASIYGEDQDDARLAGLLHDWDKQLGDAELLARVADLGLELPQEVLDMPILLHGPTAAAALRREFPQIPERVLSAIHLHTVASVEMSPLDMIIYVADKIEPKRSSRDAQFIRDEVGQVSLRELFIDAYGSSIIHLVKRHRYIYPGALDVWNPLVTEYRKSPAYREQAQGRAK
ncbi:MAG: bis(5'-nucleosyl)-tetraphosphatase (symmetrical) YqeK [Coriobacteriales bacterium]|nr:bis(5'-nucleosyl)-tetraphosphatase (symmetrical) YqeK [Coriobacteriales bacterium]